MSETLLYKKTVYNGHTTFSNPFTTGFMDSRTRSISAAKNRAKAVIMQMEEMCSFITLTFSDIDVRQSFYQCNRYTKLLLNELKKVFPDIEYVCSYHLSDYYHAHIITNIPIYRFADETSMLDNSFCKLDISTFMNSPVYGDTLIEFITDDERYYSRENLCKYLLKDFWYLYGKEYDNAKSYTGYTKIKPFIHSSGMKTIKDVKASLYMVDTDTGENICVSGYDSKPHPTGSEDIIVDDENMFIISTADTDISEKDSDISVLKKNVMFFKALEPLKNKDFLKKRDIIINIITESILYLYYCRFIFIFSRRRTQRPPPNIYPHAP